MNTVYINQDKFKDMNWVINVNKSKLTQDIKEHLRTLIAGTDEYGLICKLTNTTRPLTPAYYISALLNCITFSYGAINKDGVGQVRITIKTNRLISDLSECLPGTVIKYDDNILDNTRSLLDLSEDINGIFNVDYTKSRLMSSEWSNPSGRNRNYKDLKFLELLSESVKQFLETVANGTPNKNEP